MMKQKVQLNVNKQVYELEIEPHWTLLEVLREKLSLTGTKKGCDCGDCGACTILINGTAKLSCLILAIEAQGKDIQTIEGLANGKELHPLQQSFIDHGAVQCGYCTPGMIMSAKALLNKNPSPTAEDVKAGISGNLCRCTGYLKIIDAVLASGQKKGS